MSFPQYLPSRLDVGDINLMRERYGLAFTIHADEQLNPFDFNPRVSECYFDVMRDTIGLAKKIGASVINMHLLRGVYVTLPDKVLLLSDVYRGEYLTRVGAFIEMCEREIGDAPIKIAIENVDSNPFTESQTAALELFMRSDKFGLTLDTGHEHCLGYADSHVFARYPDKLVHMHLHDARGRSAHLPLGTGEVDIAEKIALLGDGTTCLVEVKTVAGMQESIKYLKCKQ
jgi:sugar phosphate isomerase/epimerase